MEHGIQYSTKGDIMTKLWDVDISPRHISVTLETYKRGHCPEGHVIYVQCSGCFLVRIVAPTALEAVIRAFAAVEGLK